MAVPSVSEGGLATGDPVPPAPGLIDPTSDEPRSVESIKGATSVAGDFAAIAAGRIAAAVLSFVTVLFTTRLLGPNGYGAVAIVGVVSTLVFTASTAWTGTSVRRYGREDFELRGEMTRLTWNRVVIAAPFAVLSLTLVISLKLLHALPAILTWPLVGIALGSAAAQIVMDHWVCLLETSGRLKLSAATQVVSQLIYVAALVVIFAVGLHASPELVLAFSLLSLVVFCVGVVPAVWRVGIAPMRFDRALMRRMLWLSAPLAGLVLSQYLFSSVDIVVLRIFRSQADVGVYAVAYQAYTVFASAAASAVPVLVPLFVSLRMAGRQSLVERYLRRAVTQGLFLSCTAAGLGVPILPLAVPAVFGSKFGAAGSALAVLAVGLTFLTGTFLVSPILTLHEQTRATAVINLLAVLINIVGDLVMVGFLHLGIITPAVATSASLVFLFVMFYLRARKVLDVDTRPDLTVAAPLIAGLVPTLALSGVRATGVGIVAAVLAAAAIVRWRCPFDRADADIIDKLALPAMVKRVALKAILRVT